MYSNSKFDVGNSLTILRTTALAFALGCATASFLHTDAYAQTAEATADGGGSGEATGSDSSSADFGGSGSVDTNGGSDPSATGEASTGASAQSNESSSAETQTDATANAQGTDGVYSANAEANATTTVNQSITTSLTALADAFAGNTPEAAASTIQDGVETTNARAIHRQSATATCATTCTQSVEKIGKKKTVAFAVLDDAISLAYTTKNKAYAKSGIYSHLSKREQSLYGKFFGKAAVAAQARANQKGARAKAHSSASAFNFGGKGYFMATERGGHAGFARANSFAKATACVGNCQKAPTPPAARAFTVVRDCDRQERKPGLVVFPVCEYRVVIR